MLATHRREVERHLGLEPGHLDEPTHRETLAQEFGLQEEELDLLALALSGKEETQTARRLLSLGDTPKELLRAFLFHRTHPRLREVLQECPALWEDPQDEKLRWVEQALMAGVQGPFATPQRARNLLYRALGEVGLSLEEWLGYRRRSGLPLSPRQAAALKAGPEGLAMAEVKLLDSPEPPTGWRFPRPYRLSALPPETPRPPVETLARAYRISQLEELHPETRNRLIIGVHRWLRQAIVRGEARSLRIYRARKRKPEARDLAEKAFEHLKKGLRDPLHTPSAFTRLWIRLGRPNPLPSIQEIEAAYGEILESWTEQTLGEVPRYAQPGDLHPSLKAGWNRVLGIMSMYRALDLRGGDLVEVRWGEETFMAYWIYLSDLTEGLPWRLRERNRPEGPRPVDLKTPLEHVLDEVLGKTA